MEATKIALKIHSVYRGLRINRNNHQKPTFHPLGDFIKPQQFQTTI
ncbi:hypothetical protein BAZOLSSOX_821 [uncultured Gammaproteobacteria bacterium]|jgi:hypothetical protein|nr:hypothetical protein BAZOLSSOX_821 [uncultured Gammaproteobacteria bacterium]